jgi:SAM-dependent methyltransferase
MTTWTSGYVSDVDYTFGYYAELNPLRVRLAFANAGLVFPQVGAACELGFGQGMSANLHSSASTVKWWGTDFNPSHAGFAQALAGASGAGAQLFDEAFADFCSRADLPEFDYIGLHGIWSWISDENRSVIVDFIRRKLKVGGVLYISYNTLPGWAAFAPMRHLMTEHAEVLGAEGRGIISRLDGALEFAEKLLATNPTFSRANPLVGERLKKMKGLNKHYLVHEYFGGHWYPMHFATMAEWLEPAKLQFACSANVMDAIDAVNLTAEQQAFLNEIPDAMFRQSVRDFMVNQQFRKDYWVKGLRRMSALEQTEALNETRLVLTTRRSDVPLKASGSLGEVSLNASVYTPILDLMADHKARSVAEMEAGLKAGGVNRSSLLQAVMILTGAGHLCPAQSDEATAQASKTTTAANQWLMHRARGSGEVSYLASPVTGGGVAVGRFPQLFAQALQQGKTTPQEWAQAAWDIISAQGQRIVKEGKPLPTPEENLAELTTQAQTFADSQLPVLRGLGVVGS